jgi:hypothetical protein
VFWELWRKAQDLKKFFICLKLSLVVKFVKFSNSVNKVITCNINDIKQSTKITYVKRKLSLRKVNARNKKKLIGVLFCLISTDTIKKN